MHAASRHPPARASSRPGLDLADIVRDYGPAYREAHAISPEQAAVLRDIARCRTAALGGHLDVCSSCGFSAPSYNSCRNRHCPKCQALSQARWIEGRLERVLPVHYFHVVFTIPAELRPLAMLRREILFNLLFASASATLLQLGGDPKRLGAELGVTMVLHTWTRDLSYHPHVHAIVTGGGLAPDGRWIPARRDFLFPVKVIGALFRGKFLDGLRLAHARGELVGNGAGADEQANIDRLIAALYEKSWVVYAKRPFGGAEQVIRYLGRYTHRVGISNARLIAVDEHGVTFRTRGTKVATLPPDKFLHRFLTHVLPPRFVKIRHYGLLAAGNVNTHLADARRALEAIAPARPLPRPVIDRATDWVSLLILLTTIDARRCPACKVGILISQPLPLPESRAPP
jgi:hypothetical protein